VPDVGGGVLFFHGKGLIESVQTCLRPKKASVGLLGRGPETHDDGLDFSSSKSQKAPSLVEKSSDLRLDFVSKTKGNLDLAD
jgi:hypothetical protein